jgi:hypothetical protein
LVRSQPGQIIPRDPFTEIGLVEWLKVKALSSSPGTAKKTKNNKTTHKIYFHNLDASRNMSND